MGTVIQDRPHINPASQPRWGRFERADLFAQYRELRTQGLSERQAAKELKVPRTTLQAWRLWHDTLDSCPHVAEFFQSGPGPAFFHRLVIAFHLACVEVGACGIRIVCLFLNLTGLDRFVAAFPGTSPFGEDWRYDEGDFLSSPPALRVRWCVGSWAFSPLSCPHPPHAGCSTASRSPSTRPRAAALRFICRTTRSREAISEAARPCVTYAVPSFNSA